MKNIFTFILSVHFWTTLLLVSAIMFPIGLTIFLLTFLFDRKRLVLHYFSCVWAYLVILINPYWKTRIEGRGNIRPGERYVMVANHSSGVDILILFQLFRPFKWVSKKSLFFFPFIGWNMWLNDYIPIERSRGRSRIAMMDKAADAIRAGNSVMMFPEGTRTPDGKLQSFKTGSFKLALETGVPVLPVAIKGTFHAIRKGGLTVHVNRDIKAFVLDPIPYEILKEKDPREISAMVREIISRKLESVS